MNAISLHLSQVAIYARINFAGENSEGKSYRHNASGTVGANVCIIHLISLGLKWNIAIYCRKGHSAPPICLFYCNSDLKVWCTLIEQSVH